METPLPMGYLGLVTAVLPPEIARGLGLARVGDSAMLEVTGVQPDGSVTVAADSVGYDDDAPAPTSPPPPPPELLAALGQ